MEKWMKLLIGRVEIKYLEDGLDGHSVVVMPTEDLLRLLRQDEERCRSIRLVRKRERMVSSSEEMRAVDETLGEMGVVAYEQEVRFTP